MGGNGESGTQSFHNRIVLVFDFDRTLAAATVDALLARLGVEDPEAWREQRLQPMIDDICGSSLHWDEDGSLKGVKRTVIHSEKTRYLLALAKGLDIVGANEPQDVYRDKPPEEWHVPLDRVSAECGFCSTALPFAGGELARDMCLDI